MICSWVKNCDRIISTTSTSRMPTVTCQPGCLGLPGADERVVQRRDAEQLGVVELLGELGRQQPDAADSGLRVLRDVVQHAEQREEDRHLHQQRQTARDRARAVLLVQRHRLAAHRLARELVLLALVLLLNFSQFRSDFHHLPLALDLLHEERNQGGADDQHQADDREHPGDAGGGRQAHGGEEPVPEDQHELDDPLEGPEDDSDQIRHGSVLSRG